MNQKLIKLADKTQNSRLLMAAVSKKKKKDFSEMLGNSVVSDELLEAHFGLYEGYVKALNTILDKLEEANAKENGYSFGSYSELKRRLAVPYNGALLHELYFEHLKKDKQEEKPTGELTGLIKERWGSVKNYLDDVKSTALAAGNGWVVTVHDPMLDQLDNYLITEHHIGFPAGCKPLMVLDTWEHAFALDFKTDRAEYVDKFLENLDFSVLSERLGGSSSQSESTDEE